MYVLRNLVITHFWVIYLTLSHPIKITTVDVLLLLWWPIIRTCHTSLRQKWFYDLTIRKHIIVQDWIVLDINISNGETNKLHSLKMNILHFYNGIYYAWGKHQYLPMQEKEFKHL